MAQFVKSTIIQAPVERVFAFHERDDALTLLSPKFPPARLVSKTGGITPGSRVVLQIGPIQWVALHKDFVKDRLFVDEQLSGPFKHWLHRHEFEDLGGNQSRLTDRIEYELYGGPVVTACLGWAIHLQLTLMFNHRHQVTRRYCER